MAEIERAITSMLRGDAGVGSVVGDRIYAHAMPQGELKNLDRTKGSLVFERISSNYIHTIQGDTGYTSANIQFTVYARTYIFAKSGINRVRLLFQNYSGTVIGVKIEAVIMENEWDDYDDANRTYSASAEFRIYYLNNV